jgi:hypothetical protein
MAGRIATPQQRLVQLCISWTLAISAKDILPMARISGHAIQQLYIQK